ncbi:hypothetical protein K435DRAFT_868240 [Dendrothele bispora CBS 962.96]|uniref:Uncharacterized protein n=1 Tax=Dendrothele bispora (strain CBS 962.96) TaxID=1314807 RepID=A0A4S8LCY4_DENBC|nr:hypothetical protein K435DRAFT_868240 [Dendrothele bispora CBS 962.96]
MAIIFILVNEKYDTIEEISEVILLDMLLLVCAEIMTAFMDHSIQVPPLEESETQVSHHNVGYKKKSKVATKIWSSETISGLISSYHPPYGIASGPLFDAEISNRHSIQVPALIKAAFARTPPQGGTILGEGKNVWPNVEIHKLADLYNVFLDSVLTSQNPQFPGHGREGIYNAVNGEHNFQQLAEAISQALVPLGLGEDSSSLTFSTEEEQKFFEVRAFRPILWDKLTLSGYESQVTWMETGEDYKRVACKC